MGRSRATGKQAASASEAAGRSSTRKRKAASASTEAAGDSSAAPLNNASMSREERKILRLKREEERKALRIKKEEERMIRRVKKEEGKILELKKAAMAANDASMAKLPAAFRPLPKVVKAPAAGKKTKTVLVKRVLKQWQIDALGAMPCPIAANRLTEAELSSQPKSSQDMYHEEMDIAMKLRDYHQALFDMYWKYGFAVDESEAEVTDDDDEEEDGNGDKDNDNS